MDEKDIHLNDIQRILFGEAPAAFLIEVFVRTLVMFSFCLIVVKWLGKRMNGQLSVTEMTVMIMIGAIISVPMQFPDRGLTQGFLLLTGMLLLYTGMNLLSVKSKAVEAVLEGRSRMLIKEGILQISEMNALNISRQQIFEQLRKRQIFNLGEVKRLYIEDSGAFSLFKQKEARPGLLIFPSGDTLFSSQMSDQTQKVCCTQCGFTKLKTEPCAGCPICKNNQWQTAATVKKHDEKHRHQSA